MRPTSRHKPIPSPGAGFPRTVFPASLRPINSQYFQTTQSGHPVRATYFPGNLATMLRSSYRFPGSPLRGQLRGRLLCSIPSCIPSYHLKAVLPSSPLERVAVPQSSVSCCHTSLPTSEPCPFSPSLARVHRNTSASGFSSGRSPQLWPMPMPILLRGVLSFLYSFLATRGVT